MLNTLGLNPCILLCSHLFASCQSKLSVKLPWVKLVARVDKLARPRQGRFLYKWKQEIGTDISCINHGLLSIKTQSFSEKKINLNNKFMVKSAKSVYMVFASERFMGPSPALKVFLKVCNIARSHSR